MSEKHSSKSKLEKKPNYLRRLGASAVVAATLLAGFVGIKDGAQVLSHRMDNDRIANPQRGNPPYAQEVADMHGEVNSEQGETIHYKVEVNDTPSELVARFGGSKKDVDIIAKQGKAEYGFLAAGQGIDFPADMVPAVEKYYAEQAANTDH